MDKNPDLWTIRIVCAPEKAESIAALFEEESLAVSVLAPPRQETATVEVLADGRPDEKILGGRLTALAPSIAALVCEPVGDLDWIKKVAGDFPPLTIGRWTIFGAAHKDKIKDFSRALQIDATSAFGTGEHSTTRGCLLALDELLARSPDAGSWKMLDMGCGSGILAMAFAQAAKGTALGVDMDEQSVEIANENATINGLSPHVRFLCGEGYAPADVKENGPYDLIMANIFAGPLCEMAADLQAHLKPGGRAILSGLLLEQEDAVRASHEEQGLMLYKRTVLGEWSVLAFRRPSIAS